MNTNDITIAQLVEALNGFTAAVEKLVDLDPEVVTTTATREEPESKPAEKPAPTRRGRPKGSKNKPKTGTEAKPAPKKAEPVEPKHSLDEIRELVSSNIKVEGVKEQVADALTRMGCKKLSDLLPETQDAFYDQVESIVKICTDAENDDDGDDFLG